LHISFLVDALPEKLCMEHWMVTGAVNLRQQLYFK